MSVRLKILPPVNDFNILFVILSWLRVLCLCSNSSWYQWCRHFQPWFNEAVPSFFCPSEFFLKLRFYRPTFKHILMRRKSYNFLAIRLWLGHLSCSSNILSLQFESHDAEFDIAEQCLFLHLPLLIKSSPLVIYLVKLCDLLRPQIPHFLLIILTSFLVLGFLFPYWVILIVLLYCLPPTQQVFVI